MAEKEKKPVELRCVVCEFLNGEGKEDGSIAVVELVTVISKGAGEPNVSRKELALCKECNEMGKEHVLYKCLKCQRALAAGFERNAATFQTKDAEGNPMVFSFNDNLAKMLDMPIEVIRDEAVLFFIVGCPICTPPCSCGGKCGGKCEGQGHGKHKCDGECGKDCGKENTEQ